MRYTTIIDISEYPEIYKNPHARLLYLHLALRCGYHDNDRDVLRTSFRRIEADVGISLSSVRHCVALLERYGLLRRRGNLWTITKFVMPDKPSKRATTKKQQQEIDQAAARQQAETKMARELEKDRQERAELEAQNTTPWIVAQEVAIKDYHAGNKGRLGQIRRNYKEYVEQCKQRGRLPLRVELSFIDD